MLGISPRKILLHLRVATFPKPFEVPGDLPCPLIRRENMDQKLRITLRDLRQFIDFIEKLHFKGYPRFTILSVSDFSFTAVT